MRQILILLLWTSSTCNVIGQTKVQPFPKPDDFVAQGFGQHDNIFPVALVDFIVDNESYRIPISYSLLHYSIDSSNFYIKGDFIDNYSFKLLDNGRCRPMFKKEALTLPTEWMQFLSATRQRFDSVKQKINLTNHLKFTSEPDWWQNDATPLCEDGSPMKFI